MTIESYDNDCICLDIESNIPLVILPCKHKIHLACAKKMINDTCPYRCDIPMGVNREEGEGPNIVPPNPTQSPPMSRCSYLIIFIIANAVYLCVIIYHIFFYNSRKKVKIASSILSTIFIIIVDSFIYSDVCTRGTTL